MNTLFALIIYNSVMHSAGWQVTAPLWQHQCEALKQAIQLRSRSTRWSNAGVAEPEVMECIPLPDSKP